MPCLLSEEAELLLTAILQKAGSGDGWAFVTVPDGVKNRGAASEELKRNGYISSVTLAGHEYVLCMLTAPGRNYFENKPRMQIREAMEMFIPLPQELKEKLKQITSKYKDNDYIQGNPTDASIIDELKGAGYLKKCKKYLGNGYSVKFSYEDLNYDFLEEQYNRQFTSGNNITVNGDVKQLNAASGNATIYATQTDGVDASTLNSLIEEVLKSAPKGNDEQLAMIEESLEEIRNQAISTTPKKGVINALFAGLKGITDCTGFAANVTILYQFLQANGIL